MALTSLNLSELRRFPAATAPALESEDASTRTALTAFAVLPADPALRGSADPSDSPFVADRKPRHCCRTYRSTRSRNSTRHSIRSHIRNTDTRTQTTKVERDGNGRKSRRNSSSHALPSDDGSRHVQHLRELRSERALQKIHWRELLQQNVQRAPHAYHPASDSRRLAPPARTPQLTQRDACPIIAPLRAVICLFSVSFWQPASWPKPWRVSLFGLKPSAWRFEPRA